MLYKLLCVGVLCFVLFLLQRLGRVGAGGAEGLPEDGDEGGCKDRKNSSDENPWTQVHTVYERLEISAGNPYGDRNCYDGRYEAVDHVLEDSAGAFAADSTAEYLADADFRMNGYFFMVCP